MTISYDTKCILAAMAIAVFTAAVVVYQVRVRHTKVDSEAIRWTGILLALTGLILVTTVFDIPIEDSQGWIFRAMVFGFAALFVWLVRPRTK
jgi:hypothetical protein